MSSIHWFFLFLFFMSVLLIFYSYVLFPVLLALLTWRKKAATAIKSNREYKVSILISVYNEEGIIGDKLESILKLDYPIGNIEVLIGSDASDDKTNQIVRSYSEKHPNIRLYEFNERRGKPAVINDLVALSGNDIIVLTDANVLFEKGVIWGLVAHFADERVGLVGSNILNVGTTNHGISVQEMSYIERENLIKYREGLLWGCMMGPFGGCYAIRRALFEKVPEGFLVDDFYISMKVLEKGYRCINDLESICYEDVPDDIYQEYKRKARISSGNFQNLKVFRKFLLKPYTGAGFCFISHKFLRWMTPFLIVISFISLCILSFYDSRFLFLLVGEILLLASPLIDNIARRAGIHLRVLRFVAYFSFMNLALLRGFFRYLGGIDSGVWVPTKRK